MDKPVRFWWMTQGVAMFLTLSPCHLVICGTVSAQEAALPPPRELPEVKREASAGLTLDEAIELLVQRNYDLRLKFQDIPKARADVLSAGLRNNPAPFFSADNIPYGRYSKQRPGETDYEVTITQQTDVNNKRRRRIQLAERAQRVIEALYQDAVRQEIDKLYIAFADVLEADSAVRAAKAEFALQDQWLQTARDLQGIRPPSELTQATVNRSKADSALRRAEATLLQARRDLAVLLAVPAEKSDALTPSASIHDKGPLPPCADDLIRLALKIRPDLQAYRLNVDRAQAQVRRTQAERIDDVLFFYTPYQIQSFPSQQAQAALGWEAGALAVLPVFDRKQGDLARANIEVSQSQIEVRGVEQQIVNEVRQAAADVAVSRESVEQFEREILPRARSVLDEKQRAVTSGVAGREVLLAARKDYNDAIRQYEELLLRHRRATLKLNTAVGQRLLP